ncbi:MULTISPECIES: tetratricopeptide repeat protein [Trichocoleus]|uniref:Tetratricopeptide repeat protein n=1 Tax=Trichocoleus desertorum GB2-A4 TaxID=2933944 RepID=A0ABV0J9M9_9CYAN|nr:tetratricopeptide repeat protein [Trichocoleus sp. FACHB-46]MBD1862824.1 tetratricopeptide repeat protein [Trichocoleus sp. FACHB-46]
MTQVSLMEQAKSGSPTAIAALINRSLRTKGIEATVALEEECLKILLESAQVPPVTLVSGIQKGLTQLESESWKRVEIYGRQKGEAIPDWTRSFESNATCFEVPDPKTPLTSIAPAFAKPELPSQQPLQQHLAKWQIPALVLTSVAAVVVVGWSLVYVQRDIAALMRKQQAPTGLSQENIKSHEAALAEAERELRTDSNNHEAWYRKGQALAGLNRHSEALSAYEKATEINPADFAAWSGRSLTLRRLGYDDDALLAADKALEINPKFAEGWKDRCGALFTLNRSTEAVAACDQAIKLKPDFPQAWYNRGLVLVQMGQYEKAVSDFDQATQVKPNYGGAWRAKSATLAMLQRFEDALAASDRALQAEGPIGEVWLVRGHILASQQRYEDAMQAYTKALRTNEDRNSVTVAQIVLKRKWQWYREATANQDTRRQTQLKQAGIWYYQASLLSYTVANSQELNLMALDKAVQIDPKDVDAWNSRGWNLSDLGRYEKALASYDKATQVDPEFGWAWYNRGLLLETLGRYEEALASYDKAIQAGSFPAVERTKRELLQKLGR